jgi:hypothetical protein
MSGPIELLLLLALPASGKSEIRRYLASLSPQECREEFGIGPTVQLDDFPYVHLMRRISDELNTRGHEGLFFLSGALPFREPRDWGTLIELVNEDFADLFRGKSSPPASAAEWLFARLDAARQKVGAPPVLGTLPPNLRQELAAALETEAADLWQKKTAEVPDSLEGKTIIIEFARGGADGSSLPLPAPYGYLYSLGKLSPEILAKASILYIWVTPEESRRKNTERADPDDPGSILHHGVPLAVMYADYGCDDISYLLAESDRPHAVRVEKAGQTFYLPLGRFDNRVDKTTFIRQDPSQWSPQATATLRAELKKAFSQIAQGHPA